MRKKLARLRLLSIIAAICTIGTVGIALGLGSQLITYYMVERGFSSALIGYNGTIAGIATILAAISSTSLALRFGVVPTILLMLLVGSLSFLAFYFYDSIAIWFFLRFILHYSMTILFVLSEFWINQASPQEKRGVILSIYVIILGLGFTAGPALLTLIGWHGFLPFGVGLTLIFLAALPVAFSWRASPKFRTSPSVPFRRYIFTSPAATMAALLYGAVQMGSLTLLTKFALSLGYSANEAALFMTAITFGNAVLIIPIGFLNDLIKDKRYLLLSAGVIGFLGTAALPLIANERWVFWVFLFILGGIVASFYTIGLALLGSEFKGRELAGANAAFAFCYGLGMLIGPTIIGHASDLYAPYGFSLAISTFFGSYVVLVGIGLLRSPIKS